MSLSKTTRSVGAPCFRGRRFFLGLGIAAVGLTLLSGHSPYRQWVFYREHHLIVAAVGADKVAGDLADAISARLRERLPEKQSVAAEARDSRELISLLRSHQLKLVILTRSACRDALDGAGEFSRDGTTPVRMLAMSRDHVLVGLDDMSDAVAAAVADALVGLHPLISLRESPAHEALTPIPLHAGAASAQKILPLER